MIVNSIISEFEAEVAELEYLNFYGDTLLVPTNKYHKLLGKLNVSPIMTRKYMQHYVAIAEREFSKMFGDTVSWFY